MNRLTRSARGLLVALAALVLTGGAVLAAHSLPSTATSGTQHASTVSGKTVPANGAGALNANGNPDADGTPEAQETPEAEDNDNDAADGATNANRPQNHGWFVSQAANADTPAGADSHGAYVSSVAQGDLGKPATAASGADKSAAAKAKAAAAKAARGD